MGSLRRDLLRALRGKRTQGNLSRRLGFTFNQVYRWEAGLTAIPWPEFLRLARRCGADPAAAVRRFLLFDGDPARTADLARAILGRTRLTEAQSITGISRFTLRRWLAGESVPSLEDILSLVHRLSPRLTEFVGSLVDIRKVPSLLPWHEARERERRVHYRQPWAGAVAESLKLTDYRGLPGHDDGHLAERLALPPELVKGALEELAASGAITFREGKWRPSREDLYTNVDGRGFQALRAYWFHRVAHHMGGQPPPGAKVVPGRNLAGYQMFACSQGAYDRIKERLNAFTSDVRGILAGDDGENRQVVALAAVALFDTALLRHDPAYRTA